MAVSFNFYDNFKLQLPQVKFNLLTDVVKVTLHTSAYVPSASHTQRSNLTNELATANGYTNGGVTLANKTLAVNAGVLKFDADDITLTAVGGQIGPARYAAIWDDTVTNDLLIGWIDFGEDKTAGDGTDFKIIWNAAGIFTLA